MKRRTPRAIRRASSKTLKKITGFLINKAHEGPPGYEFLYTEAPIYRALARILKKELKRRQRKGWARTR